MPLGRKPCKYLHWPKKFLQQAPAEHSCQRGIWEVDFFDSCQLCSTTWLWIWNPSSVCPRQAVRSQHFSSTKTWMCVSWDLARCLSSWNTAQETMIISCVTYWCFNHQLPRCSPSGSSQPPFDSSIPVTALENGQLPLKQCSGISEVPLDSAPLCLSIGPIIAEPTLPICPQNTHKYPPLPRWHSISF